jgi:hypothetical protein
VVNKKELSKLKEEMTKRAEQMRYERLQNDDLIPNDTHGENLEVIKEQIIDLNDKFDFLVTLMAQTHQMNVQKT